jgi:hypothetical protein
MYSLPPPHTHTHTQRKILGVHLKKYRIYINTYSASLTLFCEGSLAWSNFYSVVFCSVTILVYLSLYHKMYLCCFAVFISTTVVLCLGSCRKQVSRGVASWHMLQRLFIGGCFQITLKSGNFNPWIMGNFLICVLQGLTLAELLLFEMSVDYWNNYI